MNPADLLNRTKELNEKPAYYEHIAKLALWIVSVVLFGIVVVGSYKLVLTTYGNWSDLDHQHLAVQAVSQIGGNVIAAAQALGAVCLCVLGYRGGRRGRK